MECLSICGEHAEGFEEAQRGCIQELFGCQCCPSLKIRGLDVGNGLDDEGKGGGRTISRTGHRRSKHLCSSGLT